MLKRYLEEASSNEGRPSDGQIYRNIRRYSLEGDLEAEGQWWAHLSKNKRRDLKRLLRHERYTEALDPLLKFGGLWDGDGVKGGMWKKVMDLRCEEVGWLQLCSEQADTILRKSSITGSIWIHFGRTCSKKIPVGCGNWTTSP